MDACKKEIEDKCKTPLTPAEKTKAEACLDSAKQFRKIIIMIMDRFPWINDKSQLTQKPAHHQLHFYVPTFFIGLEPACLEL